MLHVKLHIPTPRADMVPRPRLVGLLDKGLRLGGRLSLIAAPPGFGKTTLAAEWLSSDGTACASRKKAWISLDEGDNDPARFFACLVAALEECSAEMGQATRSLLGSPQMPSVESLAATLITDIFAIPDPFILVLDDCQSLHNAPIHCALAMLLDRQPSVMHIAVVTRVDPPLPLPRLRVRGQLTEIRTEDLRFTREEAEALISRVSGRPPEPGNLTVLEARTEGWAAGLQLAALSMRNTDDIAAFVDAFGGSNRHILDYLAEEVLSKQTEETRRFLLQTAILDRLCAPLCDAVTGNGDGAEMLRRLETANLFLIPLDDRREWYRYHRLFADYLRTEIPEEGAGTLHLRAAHWFEAHGLLPEAVTHVLAYAVATGDTEEAVRAIIPAGLRALSEGALVTLLGWLDALPDAAVRANGCLVSYKAWSLIMTGRSEEAESYIRSAEDSLGNDASPLDRGRVLSLRCAVSGNRDVLEIAPRALEVLGDADPLSRVGVLFLLGNAQDALGDAKGAEETFREAHRLGLIHGHAIMSAVTLAHMAISIDCQGRRREALKVCRQGIRRHADTRGNPLPVAGFLHAVLGKLAYDENDLDGAHRYLQTALDLGRQSAATLVILYAMETLARVLGAMGKEREALAVIGDARDLACGSGEPQWDSAGAAVEAGLRLRQGDAQAARQWAARVDLPLDSPDQTRKHEYTQWIRILLGSGREREAQSLLARLEDEALGDGRNRHLLTILIQSALAERGLGNVKRAQERMEEALRLAAPEGYVRAFLDEGPELRGLLASVRRAAPRFVDGLLAAFPDSAEQDAPQPCPPVESLSAREQEVLRRLATDSSVPEIARDLYVEECTIRSHVKHIYGKLDAHNRYEAVARAKSLGLL